MPIKALSLDLDGTLVSRSYVDYFWLEIVPRLYAERWGLQLEEAKRQVFRQYDEVGPRDLRWYQPRYWFDRFGLDADLLRTALEEASKLIVPYEDALELLKRLQNRLTVVISTSASREFIDLVLNRVPEIRARVSRIFSSVSDFSLPSKPPEFYLRVLAELRVEPHELAHAGDDEEADYAIPLSLGIRAFFIDRSGGKGVSNLLQLLEILEPDR